VIDGKGVLNNRISEHIFSNLNDIGVPTHFIRRLNMREQLIREVEIIPLEIVVRELLLKSVFALVETAPFQAPVYPSPRPFRLLGVHIIAALAVSKPREITRSARAGRLQVDNFAPSGRFPSNRCAARSNRLVSGHRAALFLAETGRLRVRRNKPPRPAAPKRHASHPQNGYDP
jgi:hypothetical protein